MRDSRAFLIALSFFLSAGIASAGIFSRKKPTELAVRTTAYTHSEADHLAYGRKTAAGGTLKYGRNYSSAAADWSKFPLGTKFKIDGMNTTFVVDDYGRALVGTETIDIYKPSRSAMNQWGVKNVDIKILEYGDYEKSREILEERTKYAHVRQMLAGIDKNRGPNSQKKSGSFFTKKAPTPVPPTADPPPAMQMASAPSAPKPVSKSALTSAPAPSPEKPTAPTPPAIAAPPIPASTYAAASVPENTTQPKAEPVTPKITPAPHPSLPAPALRKVKPLQLASLTSSAAPSEPVASYAAIAEDKPAAPSNELRKRAFRPLTPGANG